MAIGVLRVCLVSIGANKRAPIIIHIFSDDGEPAIIIHETNSLLTFQLQVASTAEVTTMTTAKVPTITTAGNSTT